MAGATDLSVRTEGRNPCPRPAWTGWPVDVQSKILQQFSSLVPVGLAVHANVVNRFREQRRRTLDLHGPAGFVPNGVAVFSSATDGGTGLAALNGDFTIAGIEIHLRDVGILRDDVVDDVLGLVHVHHCVNGRAKHDLPLDATRNLSNQPVLPREGFHVRGDDGDVSSFQVHFVLNVARDDLRNLVFQFTVGHLHDVHLWLPQSTWTTAHPERGDKRQRRGRMRLTSGVLQCRLGRLAGSRNRA